MFLSFQRYTIRGYPCSSMCATFFRFFIVCCVVNNIPYITDILFTKIIVYKDIFTRIFFTRMFYLQGYLFTRTFLQGYFYKVFFTRIFYLQGYFLQNYFVCFLIAIYLLEASSFFFTDFSVTQFF